MLQLLSLSTEVIFWLITAAALVLTVIFWHKFATINWINITIRFSLIITIQAFALASLGLTVNRAGDFYDSWSDLFGAQGQYQKIALSPSALAQVSPEDLASATRTKGGSLIFRKVIRGAKSDIANVVYVVASPTIARSLEGPTHSIGNNYQIVELFPGTPGVPQTWIGTLGGITTMENLENAGKIPPTIAVIPAINVEPGQDTECMNFVGGAQVETWITSDMQKFMQTFMGIDNRQWSAFGYSTGGWCAAEVAVLHQQQYSQAVSLAGYFQPQFELGLSKREKNYLYREYNLLGDLQKGPRNTKLMIIASRKDHFANASAQQFIAGANSLIPIKYIPIPTGGHNIGVWKPFVATGFLWISGANEIVSAVPSPTASAIGSQK